MVGMADILLNYKGQKTLDRKADLANLLIGAGGQATNPLVQVLAGFVGGSQLANLNKEQESLDKTTLQKQLEDDEFTKKLQLQQLGVSQGTLDLARQKQTQEQAQLTQQQELRKKMAAFLSGTTESQRPEEAFVGPMQGQSNMTDPNKLNQAAIVASIGGDKDLSSSLSGIAKNISKNGGNYKLVKLEQDLRKEYSGEAKPFKEISGAYNRIQASTKEPSAAGDIALIFNYMKMLDPGSTVREGEFATAENAAGVPVQIQQTWNKLQSGEKLIPEQRADFLNQAKNIYVASKEQQGKLQTQYTDFATRAGIDPKNIIPDFSLNEKEIPKAEGWQTLPSGLKYRVVK